MRLLLTALLTVSTSFGSTLLEPSVNVRFGGSGYPEPGGGHNLGGPTGTSFVSDSRASQPADIIDYELSGFASFGTLGASSKSWGALPSGQSRIRHTTSFFWDRVLLTVPGGAEATYRWQPTVRLTGFIDWTGLPVSSFSPAGSEIAQTIRVEGQTVNTHYPHQVDLVTEGIHDELLVLPEIVVPANEYFNYRLLLVAYSQVGTTATAQVTSSEATFGQTLDVVGLSVKDSGGNSVAFQVQADSGAVYDASGINAIPEPSSIALVLGGATLAILRRRAATAP